MTYIPPPWEQQKPEAPRAANGQFVPGQSGNPNGRPVGIADKRHRVAKAFDHEFDAIGAAIVERAKAGDMAAASLYLSRVEPPLRPKAERVSFKLDPAAPLADQASAVLLAVSQSELSPDDGRLLIDCLAAAASLRKLDAFELELLNLRTQLAQLTRQRNIPGGVAYVDDDELPGAPVYPCED